MPNPYQSPLHHAHDRRPPATAVIDRGPPPSLLALVLGSLTGAVVNALSWEYGPDLLRDIVRDGAALTPTAVIVGAIVSALAAAFVWLGVGVYLSGSEQTDPPLSDLVVLMVCGTLAFPFAVYGCWTLHHWLGDLTRNDHSIVGYHVNVLFCSALFFACLLTPGHLVLLVQRSSSPGKRNDD